MPNEQELRKHRFCFTGHRPEKLHKPEEQIKKDLEAAILLAVDDGFVTFISGMARGVDIWVVENILRFWETNPSLHLVAASPYRGFESNWAADLQSRYNAILQQADLVKFVCLATDETAFNVGTNGWLTALLV